jgi:uncharacterized protein YbjT (DUF2867 family)
MFRLTRSRFAGRMTNNVFVAGGTGKTGRRVTARLQHHARTVHPGSRTGRIPFDWARPETWAAAIGDADAVYIAYSPDLAVPQAPADLAAFGRTAIDQGVRTVVLLSGRGEPEAQDAERALRDVAPQTTVLRASWMNQNFTEGDFAGPVRAGRVTLPEVGVGEPFIDADDVADAAVAVLLSTAHQGRVYELTGPRLLTFADAVREIGAALGRDLVYEGVPLDDFTAAQTAAGVPAEIVTLIRYLFGTLFDGRNTSLSSGVQDLLGRAPRDFSTFATEAATAGAWS